MSRIQSHRLLQSHHLLQIHARPQPRVLAIVQIHSADFQKRASHFDVMMNEIAQQELQAHESFEARVQREFHHLSDVPNGFNLRFDVDLVAFLHVKFKIDFQHLRQLQGDIRRHEIDDRCASRQQRQQIESSSVNIEKRFYESLPVWFVVEVEEEINGSGVDELPVDTVWEVGEESV